MPQPGQSWETHLPKGPVCPSSNWGSCRAPGGLGPQGSSSDTAQLARMMGAREGCNWKPGLWTLGTGIRHQALPVSWSPESASRDQGRRTQAHQVSLLLLRGGPGNALCLQSGCYQGINLLRLTRRVVPRARGPGVSQTVSSHPHNWPNDFLGFRQLENHM